jgi:hypothetical protein
LTLDFITQYTNEKKIAVFWTKVRKSNFTCNYLLISNR